jgi:hypothetical protein
MNPGALVILHLVQPTEKFWGVLLRLAGEGITVRGINLSSFDDWARGVGRHESTLDLATMFVPLFRVERMFLDEQVGEVESYSQRFHRMAGVAVESHLGLGVGEGGRRDEPGLVS